MTIVPELLQATEARYAARQAERSDHLQKMQAGSVLQVDAPERVEQRIKRFAVTRASGRFTGINRPPLPAMTPAAAAGYDAVALERILGKNDLMSIHYLERGLQVSRSVGRIHVRMAPGQADGFGTGFLVSPRLLLTNHHVLPTATLAASSRVEFNVQDGMDGQPLRPALFDLAPNGFFITDPDLDFTLVAVREQAHDGAPLHPFGWIPLIEDPGKVILGEYLTIIQHPNGEPKQLALRENRLVDLVDAFLHYHTDTAPGSSGSPVLNDQWEVVGLHHSGVPRRDDHGRILTRDGTLWRLEMGEQRIDWLANEGVRVSAIVQYVRAQPIPDAQRRLRDDMLTAVPTTSPVSDGAIPSHPKVSREATLPVPPLPPVETWGSATWTVPLHVSVQLDQPVMALGTPSSDQCSATSQPAESALGRQDPREARRGDALARMYRKLGYTGKLTTSPQAMEIAPTDHNNGLPPLGLATLDRLKHLLRTEPATVLARARNTWDPTLTEAQLRSAVSQAEKAVKSPETFLQVLEAMAVHDAATQAMAKAPPSADEGFWSAVLPEGFSFPAMIPSIAIEPENTQYETIADAVRWALFAGPAWLGDQLGLVNKAPFPAHDRSRSGFVYDLLEPTPDTPLEIALFSDFGTGLYHSRYIAEQLRTRRVPYAIHLGDVYYAGRESEFDTNCRPQLQPLLGQSRVFLLNANHEMLSGGFPYFRYLDFKRNAHPHLQPQEGSYFCLRSEQFQLIALDTNYYDEGRLADATQKQWLERLLREGQRQQRLTILLTSGHPYEYGKEGFTPLLAQDLMPFVQEQLIDLWFWGNTHYCALFDWTPRTPFVGSCIGHAGYPYGKEDYGKSQPAPIRFLETSTRFPASTGLRPDCGNNGYCLLWLRADGAVELKYMDWMGNLRCEATATRGNGQGRSSLTHREYAPIP